MEHMWKTRDGERMPVKKMTDSHLINSINFISRVQDKTAAHAKWLLILTTEAKRRQLTIMALDRLPEIMTTTSEALVKSSEAATETFAIFTKYQLTCKCGSDNLYPVYFDYWQGDDGCQYDLDIICYSCSEINFFTRVYDDPVAYDTWNGKIVR